MSTILRYNTFNKLIKYRKCNFYNFEEYPYRSISIVYIETEPTVAGTSLQPSTAFPVTTLV